MEDIKKVKSPTASLSSVPIMAPFLDVLELKSSLHPVRNRLFGSV